ncbi:serine/threonine protein kinase [Humibacillus xanthopallidus]|uniref:non-specific serine/threonine protein kinase n=1 Tax=Humibacillus xanthopallidus TaxID=412689 RepID=A0A543HXJ0_9MICO|nr:serine/threonine protein kinase [Humibacillus xanthopallidus]
MPGHRVESVLGRGASGTVWQGRDAMGQAVAIKVAHEVGWLADEDATRTEAHVLMAVRHEHLVTLRDVVAMADGRVALVFDLVIGASVRSTVSARGRLRPGETVTVVTPMCEAVEALHGAGGLHGDISPSNVMLTADGKPLLLDLGAARLAGASPDAPIHGTEGFLAPEVRQGFAPTEASDVFSLGALAWFCLTGNGAPDTMLRLDPEVIRSHVGSQLAEVIGACIDPDPARRPSAPEAARLFYEAAPAEAVEVVVGADQASALTHRIRAEAADEAAAAAPEATPGWWRVSRARRSWSGRSAGAAALFAVLVGVVVVALAAGVVSALSRATASETVRPAGSEGSSRPSVVIGKGVTPGPGTSATPTPSPASPTATSGVEALLRQVDAPRTSPQDLIQALSDRRAEALVRRDPGRLAGVDERSSPAHAADVAVIARLRAAEARWEGLSLEVAHAAVVSAEGAGSVVRARVDWTAYTLVSAGERVERPAATGEVLDFTLVRGSEGWRIAAVSAPAS